MGDIPTLWVSVTLGRPISVRGTTPTLSNKGSSLFGHLHGDVKMVLRFYIELVYIKYCKNILPFEAHYSQGLYNVHALCN